MAPKPPVSERPRTEFREISAQTTIVTLVGEHDLSTKACLVEQFERARMASIVIVDLTSCTFIDSTIIGAILAQRLARPRQRVEIVLPQAGSEAHRALHIVAMPELIATYPTLERALARVQPPR